MLTYITKGVTLGIGLGSIRSPYFHQSSEVELLSSAIDSKFITTFKHIKHVDCLKNQIVYFKYDPSHSQLRYKVDGGQHIKQSFSELNQCSEEIHPCLIMFNETKQKGALEFEIDRIIMKIN